MTDDPALHVAAPAPAAAEVPQAAPGAPIGAKSITIRLVGPGQYAVSEQGFGNDLVGLLGLLDIGRFMILEQLGPKRPQPKIELPPAPMPRMPMPMLRQMPPGRYGGRP